jgi:hypothetical protein
MERHLRCVQCRKLRTGNYVLGCLLTRSSPRLSDSPALSLYTFESREGKPLSTRREYEPFAWDWSTIAATKWRYPE